MWDLLTACLLAACGLATYVDFLLSKDQKTRIGTVLVGWRDSLASTPLYQVPTRELQFAIGVYSQASRSWWRIVMIGLLVPAIALLVGSAIVLATPIYSISWNWGNVIGSWYMGSVVALVSVALMLAGTQLVLKRFQNKSYQAIAFVLWHLFAIAASLAVAPVGMLLLSIPALIILFVSEPAETWDYIAKSGRWIDTASRFLDGFAFQFPRSHHRTVEAGYFLVAYTASLLFWFRITLTVTFVCSWLVSPIVNRFAFLNVRGLAELEKGHLTVAAVGLAAIIKGAAEIGKALLK